MKRIRSLGHDLFAAILIVIGLFLLLYPDLQAMQMKRKSEQKQMELQEQIYRKETGVTSDEPGQDKDMESSDHEPEDSLYQICKAYNEKIFVESQEGFRDAFSYEQVPIGLEGLEEEIFGYLEIPALSSTLPVYIGASMENLAKGLAVLGQTSIPIGGKNTHAVISGHRGWSTGPFLRDIENIRVGDRVYLTGPWEILTYQVEKIDIIPADGTDRLLIQEGKDMLTLLTCHPYLSHGEKDRYVVYCVRVEEQKNSETEEKETDASTEEESRQPETILDNEGVSHASSAALIRLENGIRRGIAVMTVFVLIVSFLYRQHKKGKENRP